MKRYLSITLLLSLVFCLSLSPSASALASVTFKGGSDNFVLSPGEDLFEDLKEAVPGDTLTQTITVRNEAPEFSTVKIYLRAEPINDTTNPPSSAATSAGETAASMADFLSQLVLRVYNGSELISSGPANEPGALTGNVLLGEFAEGEETVLTLELEVPATLGSEYAHRTGELDWIFTAEGPDSSEEPITPDEPDEPEITTADTGRFTVKNLINAIETRPIIFGIIAAVIIGALAITKNRRRTR